jgi:hypothetical protein
MGSMQCNMEFPIRYAEPKLIYTRTLYHSTSFKTVKMEEVCVAETSTTMSAYTWCEDPRGIPTSAANHCKT